jgi:antirestriction protein ArdC
MPKQSSPASRHRRPDAVDRRAKEGLCRSIWMTFKQALELGGYLREGEKGSLVLYAIGHHSHQLDAATGDDHPRSAGAS